MKTGRLWLAVTALLIAPLAVQADSVLLGATNPTTNQTLTLETNNVAGMTFTLNTTVTFSQLDLMLWIGINPVLIQLTDALGSSATSANVLASWTLSDPNWGGHTFSLPLSLTLGPGTYYIVGSSNTVSGDSNGTPFFPLATNILPSSVGSFTGLFASAATPDLTFPPGNNFATCSAGPNCPPLTYALHGTVVGAPEPGTLLLLGAGLVPLALARRRATK